MLGLVLRQLMRYRLAIFLILGFWSLGGYFLYLYKNQIFTYLGYILDSPSLPKKEDLLKAYQNIQQAKLRLKESQTDLSIMEKSCSHAPLQYRGGIDKLDPHWLEKLENWRIPPLNQENQMKQETQKKGQSESIADTADYWKKHRPFVLQSLKNTSDAMRVSYEIQPASITPNSQNKKTVIVPRLFERYAKSVCQPYIAMIAWGQYAVFQETQAAKRIKSRNSKKILRELAGAPLYIEALRNFLGYTPAQSLDQNFCSKRNHSLACMSPREAVIAYKKLIAVVSAGQKPKERLRLAQSILIASQLPNVNEREYQKKAVVQLRLAARSYKTELEARLSLASIWLHQKKYRLALGELRRLAFLRRAPNFPAEKFSRLAKRALIGAGRLNEADCFAVEKFPSRTTNKKRYCQNLKL